MLLNLHKSQQIRNVRHVHFSLHFTFVSTIISVCMCKGREEICLYRLICRPLHSMLWCLLSQRKMALTWRWWRFVSFEWHVLLFKDIIESTLDAYKDAALSQNNACLGRPTSTGGFGMLLWCSEYPWDIGASEQPPPGTPTYKYRLTCLLLLKGCCAAFSKMQLSPAWGWNDRGKPFLLKNTSVLQL